MTRDGYFTDTLGLDWRIGDEEGEMISAALEHALANVVSWLAAHETGADAGAKQMWLDRMYEDLRDLLTEQQLVRAVLALVHVYAVGMAEVTVGQFRRLPERVDVSYVRDQHRRDTTG